MTIILCLISGIIGGIVGILLYAIILINNDE